MTYIKRRGRRMLVAAVVMVAGVVAWTGATQAATTPTTPKCTAGQQFIGNSPPNSVQLYFSCNQTIQSFRVDVTKPLGSAPTAAAVESNGQNQAPPEGFTCTPNSTFPKSYTCSGSAASPHLVRVTENYSGNPCPDLHQRVTVGTDTANESGAPTGSTVAFDARPLSGCSAPPAPKAAKCKKGFVKRHGKCVRKHKKHCKKGYVRRHGKCRKKHH